MNAAIPRSSILVLTQFLLYINEFPYNALCNITIYSEDATLYSNCNWASDVRQQLKLASELKSHLLCTIDCSKKQIVDFGNGKFIRLTGLMILVLLM